MAHSSPDQSPEHLPATRMTSEAAVEPVRIDGPPFAHDLVRSIDAARTAVRSVTDLGAADITVSALTVLDCVGATPADALQAAAEAARRAPLLEPHSLALARVPGFVEGIWEWRITMTVSARNPMTGEYGGATHHADRRR